MRDDASKRALLGFDARLEPARAARHWDAARRALFLLDPAIAAPLSVDTHVWPSWCRYAEREWAPPGHAPVDVAPLGFRHGALGLWQDREALAGFLDRHGLADRAWIVALELIGEAVGDAHWRAVLDVPGPAIDPGWTLLGHDIADSGFTSALSNCGYRADERQDLARDWAGRLNRHGLVGEAGDAAAFARLSEARIQEHAPFFVYALHAVAVTG